MSPNRGEDPNSTARITADKGRVDHVVESEDRADGYTSARVQIRHAHRATAAGSLGNLGDLFVRSALHPDIFVGDDLDVGRQLRLGCVHNNSA